MPQTTPPQRRPAARVLARLTSEPWAIAPEALRELLAIASRAQSDPEAVALLKADRVEGTQRLRARDGVGILELRGPIFRHANLFTEVSGATSLEVFAKDFAAAVADPTLKGVLLDVDSPGGQVAGVGEMASLIAAARPQKPIVAYVGHQASSAGYYLASAASMVVAAPQAMLGSIGVVMTYIDGTKAQEAMGVEEIEIVSSQSPHKRDTPKTEDGRARLQALVDQWADLFVADVAQYRGVEKAAVLSDFGQGGHLIGSKAVSAGLADRLGSFERTLRYIASGRAAASPRRRGVPAASGRRAVVSLSRSPSPRGVPPMAGQRSGGWWEQAKAYFNSEAPPASAEAPDDGYDAPDPTGTVAATGANRATPVNPSPQTLTVTARAVEAPEIAALRRELAAEREAREAEQAARQQERAETLAARDRFQATVFAKDEVAAGRLSPAQRANLEALYVQAAQDDRDRPVDAGGTSRLTALKAHQQAVQPHGFLKPRIAAGADEPAAGRGGPDDLFTLPNHGPNYNPEAAARSQVDDYLKRHGKRRASSD